jgi:DNA/RNA-binding domain of Phe-tRNA-synthetase-like protein
MMVELSIDPALQRRVALGLLVLEDVTVLETAPALVDEVEGACRTFRERHAGVPSGSVPGVEEARRLYKALGLDPTKTRPSNESLLRRALKGEALYRINTLVDALNLCSLREQLPYGLYDLAHVVPPIVLRLGRGGEGYEGIRKGWINVEGRPTLVDAQGPFGNPTSDSGRTSIGLTARTALVVTYAPFGLGADRLQRVLDDTAATLIRHNGGRVSHSRLL